ncbi:prophage protein [Campylobacter hyointestinalis]|nr:DUF1828 domain-containing protein [Campylobacter hyointestinalis]CUU89651.1 prophage protein [Campylobacter hyointestinalis]
MLDINALVESYISYLKSDFDISKIDNNTYEISTPFLDRHNDNISIYAILHNDTIKLTDGGETISDLQFSGLDINKNKKKRELDIILNGFSIDYEGDELYTIANKNNFARKQHNIIQAIISVNDMFVLSQNKVNSFFFDDVISFFDNNDIRNSSNIIMQGKSHLTHKIDFIISKSKTQNERLIKLINTPNKDNLKATLFTFNDLEDRVYNTDDIIIFNDNQKIVTDDLLEATKQYNIKSLLWSKKEDFKDYLAA